MWISKTVAAMWDQEREAKQKAEMLTVELRRELDTLRSQMSVHVANMDWFKHRLTQVERERAQLIAAAIGVKIAVPEFVPTYRPDEALGATMDFGNMGGDAAESVEMEPTDNFSGMPKGIGR